MIGDLQKSLNSKRIDHLLQDHVPFPIQEFLNKKSPAD